MNARFIISYDYIYVLYLYVILFMHFLCLLLAFMLKQLLPSCFHLLCSFALFYFSVFVLCSFVSLYGFALLWLLYPLQDISTLTLALQPKDPAWLTLMHTVMVKRFILFIYIYFTVRIISLYFISIKNLVLFFHLHSLDHFRQSYLINAMTEGWSQILDFMCFDGVS